ncbi:MAG: hypothetical protein MI919_04595 [Holophagales bacterium]|nr:hypothetical protein [Holophagales bacterium]
MSDPRSTGSAPRLYQKFFTTASLILLGLVALGFPATARLAGSEGVPAMLAALAAAAAASLVGTLPIYSARNKTPQQAMPSQFGAMATRLAAVSILGVAIAFSGFVPIRPFLIWLAIAHGALLVADTQFARGVVIAAQARAAR